MYHMYAMYHMYHHTNKRHTVHATAVLVGGGETLVLLSSQEQRTRDLRRLYDDLDVEGTCMVPVEAICAGVMMGYKGPGAQLCPAPLCAYTEKPYPESLQ